MSKDQDNSENVNIMRSYDLGQEIPAERITQEFDAVYSPKDFPGIVWVYNDDITSVIYNSGNIVSHGPTEPTIDDAVGDIEAQLFDVGVLD